MFRMLNNETITGRPPMYETAKDFFAIIGVGCVFSTLCIGLVILLGFFRGR